MRKLVITLLGILVGSSVGYVSRDILAYYLLQKRDGPLQWAFFMNVNEALAFCSGMNLEEQRKYLNIYQRNLKLGLDKYPDDELGQMYYAFSEVGYSTLESQLNHPNESKEHMDTAQKMLSRLGWQDVSSGHINAVVSRVYPGSELFLKAGQQKVGSSCSEQPNTTESVTSTQ